MPIVSTPDESLVVMRYQVGTNEHDAPIIRQKSLAGIKESATDQQVYEVAEALFSLLNYPLLQVRRDNRVILTRE